MKKTLLLVAMIIPILTILYCIGLSVSLIITNHFYLTLYYILIILFVINILLFIISLVTYIEMHNNRFIDERDRSFKFLNSDIDSKILSKWWIRLTYVLFVVSISLTIIYSDFIYIQTGFAQLCFFYYLACYRMRIYPLKGYVTTKIYKIENHRKMARYPLFFIGSFLCLFLIYNLVLQPNFISYSSDHTTITIDKSILEPKEQVQKDNLLWYFCSSKDYEVTESDNITLINNVYGNDNSLIYAIYPNLNKSPKSNIKIYNNVNTNKSEITLKRNIFAFFNMNALLFSGINIDTKKDYSLSIYEESSDKSRPQTIKTLKILSDIYKKSENKDLLRQELYKNGSIIKADKPSINLVYHREGGTSNHFDIYLNPKKEGFLSIKVIGNDNKIYFDNTQEDIHSGRIVGWSENADEQFYYFADIDVDARSFSAGLPTQIQAWLTPLDGSKSELIATFDYVFD